MQCFDCVYRNIMETSHEWIECHCKKDGRWHNPFSPNIGGECENYQRKAEKDGQRQED